MTIREGSTVWYGLRRGTVVRYERRGGVDGFVVRLRGPGPGAARRWLPVSALRLVEEASER